MSQSIYFLGIGGTLMGSLALLAKESGYDVAGSDDPIYPPMSGQLASAGITVHQAFAPSDLDRTPDKIVIGNAKLPRGDPAVEFVLNQNLDYTSGAAWLGETILRDRWVIAIAGTHGKTTTTSMVAWILDYAGLNPGFLIGGVPKNFGTSARLGKSPFFVVEADEYDTSYFDRRSKFVHYRPKTLVINNLEYDHADIFDDLAAIQTQFHHLIRTVPSDGLIIAPEQSSSVDEVLRQGCWTPVSRFVALQENRLQQIDSDNGDLWHASTMKPDGSRFTVALNNTDLGSIEWSLLGAHNVENALTAIAASRHAGVPAGLAIEALSRFEGVKRRMELFAEKDGLKCYDDFAHHPSAIRTTLQGLRNHVGNEHILAIVEPRTHTMSLGTLRDALCHCTAPADEVVWFRSENMQWDLAELVNGSLTAASVENDLDRLVERIGARVGDTCHVVIMSNGGFGGIYDKISRQLSA